MKSVIFDLDGTLLDTLEDLADAVNSALAAEGFPPHEPAAYRLFVGDGAAKLIQRALPEDRRDAETQSRCLAAMRANYATGWARKTTVYEGVPEMLNGLAAAGISMSVLSNKPDDFTVRMVAHYFGEKIFRIVRGHRPGCSLKPAPDAALEILAAQGSNPMNTALLGDSAVDIQTARAARLVPIGALWGFRTREELETAGARILLRHPSDLLPISKV
ncbi:MAG: HAD family hydrolase [Kiritimatiellia bacterium]|nr:HAD family hydrolase [Kiritimatiellia bacterium]